jgi:regulator of sigma E protease
MSGPPGIARLFYETSQADLRIVVWFAVMVNVNLAILNLLPIPVLDGGHLVFATLARLRGRELPQKIVGALQGAFAIALICLMLYVSFRDVKTWVRDAREDDTPAQQR